MPLGYFRAKPAARPEARYAPSTSLRPASATKSTRKAPDSWCFMFSSQPNSSKFYQSSRVFHPLGAPFRLCALPECPWVKSRPPHQGRAPKTHGFFGVFLKGKSRGNRVFVAARYRGSQQIVPSNLEIQLVCEPTALKNMRHVTME